MKLSTLNAEHTEKLIDSLLTAMETEQKFHEKLVTYTDRGMVILDRKTSQFLFANPAAQQIYNRSLEELRTLKLTNVTLLEFVDEEVSAVHGLNDGKFKLYRMAKAFVIPPDNVYKVAFLELVEIATENQFPYILGIIIEKTQLQQWYEMTTKVFNLLDNTKDPLERKNYITPSS